MNTAERERIKAAILRALRHGRSFERACREQLVAASTCRRWQREDRDFDARVRKALPAWAPKGPAQDEPVGDKARLARKARVLEALVGGASLKEAAAAAGVEVTITWMWRLKDPKFDAAVVALWRCPTGRRPQRVSQVATCRADGCFETDLHARGLCVRHYHQQRRTGRLRPAGWVYGRQDCSVAGCEEQHRARGLCAAHYETAYRSAT